MSQTQIAVVIPHYQRQPGLLSAALRSAFAQTIASRMLVIICDDGSPSPATTEVDSLTDLPREQIKIITRPNGGAGAARNTALDNVPAGIEFVAYLDSDDAWRPHHLESAVHALERGYDAYFADFFAVGYRAQSNFERIGSLKAEEHKLLDAGRRLHELGVTAIEHTVADGGGVIGTPTVVYRYGKFPTLRFREEFYNGQDFFFWMDLGELGARFIFSFGIECDCGEGINIYQASGWGSEKSLQRLRNEIFVWTSVERFYQLSPALKVANRRTIRNLQEDVVKDVMHRLRHRRPISVKLIKDIIGMDPAIIALAPFVPLRILRDKLFSRGK